MKKVLTALAIMLFSFGATNSFAQELRWGVKAGMNFNKAPQIDNIFRSEARMGYHIGPMVELSLPIIPVSVDASLLFSNNSAELKDATDAWNKVINTNFIELPINIKATVFSFSGINLMLIAGPSFSYLVSHNLKDLGTLNELGDFKTKRFAVGLNAGVGVQAFKFLQLTATYNATFADTYKFTSISDTARDFIKAQNKGFRISAAVLF